MGKNKYRLKLSIPQWKWDAWGHYIEENSPYSDFFFNFSQWVRTCLRQIPLPYLIIHTAYNQNLSLKKKQFRNSSKIEKTVWISSLTHQALNQSRDMLSVNQYVIYILEFFIFGESDPTSNFIQLSRLENRIQTLERKIMRLSDKEYILSNIMQDKSKKKE